MRTKEAILADMLNNLSDDYQKTEGFPIYDILSAVAGGLETQNADVEFASNQNNVYQISGDHLTQFIYERTGLKRRSGAASWGYIQITTNQDTVIPAGSLFATQTGLMFQNLTPAVINNTTLNVYVECTTEGADTNVPAGTVNTMAVTVAGVTKVNNADSFVGGLDSETDDELRTRYILHISNPSSSGNKLDYKEWALEVDGVSNARVLPLWNGDNTVKVVLIGEGNTAPSQSVVEEVQNYIDPNISGSGEGVAPIGAYCTCVAATQKTVNIVSTITVEPGYTPSAVQADTITNIKNFFIQLDFDAKNITATQIMRSIFDTAGVSDCTVPTLNDGASVTVSDTEVAVFGTITINIA